MTSSSSSFNNNATKMKILVVDDEEDIIFTIKSVLEQNGFKVDGFSTAPSALEHFVPDVYSIAILDIKMPDMNGFELYEKIRGVDNKVKVIFLTALAELRDYEGFGRNEAFLEVEEKYFARKPIENEDLIQRVRTMLKQ
jgi:DNA-binding response OmpR family regulator